MDLKVYGTNNLRKNRLNNEKSALERFEIALKNTIFGVLFVLLKDEEISIYSCFIIALIQFVQMLLFPFHNQINKIWNAPKITDYIEKTLEYANFSAYLKSVSWNIYIFIFYIFVLLILFVIGNIIYVSYSYTKNKFLFTWPLHMLRILFTLFTSIKFIPLLDFFISILNCTYDDNKKIYVHSVFNDVQCWNGIYILHAVFSVIITIIFTGMALVICLTYFECRSTSNDPTARVNSRPNFVFLLYEVVMVISLKFMSGEQYQYIILAEILGGSTILFMKFYFNTPYYNEIIGKLWSTLMSINLWTAAMLTFSKIMENTLFQGSIIAWMLGIPFIILIVLTIRDHRIDLLLINVNKFQSGEEMQHQIRFLLKLVTWQATNRNAAILLDGYIELHKQTCTKDDCPFNAKSIKNHRLTKTLMDNDENLNEKYAILIQLLYKMYFYGIKKFPNNTSLRISYSFFLLEKMHTRHQALQELGQAEQNKPPFDEQFIIFRYKKIIEEKIAQSKNENANGLDIVSEAVFQHHLLQCQTNIEKSALLHMEFWSQLSEDTPDLAKLNDIGSKISQAVAMVDDHWNKLQKINTNIPKAIRLYGKYLLEIMNDKEGGEELLEKSRTIINLNANKKAMNLVNMAFSDDTSNDSTPTICMAGEKEKFAIIININIAAASLFGYNKTELTNRKVNMLMPQIYSKIHDTFVENFINTCTDFKSGSPSKERLVFGKSKSNYILPLYLRVKVTSTILHGIQFIGIFRQEKNLKNSAYILTNNDGLIDSISSSCISLLKIDHKMIVQKRSNIQDFIPNIIKDKNNIFTNLNLNNNNARTSAVITFNYLKESEYYQEGHENNIQVNCSLYEIYNPNNRDCCGYQFRFEKSFDKNNVLTPPIYASNNNNSLNAGNGSGNAGNAGINNYSMMGYDRKAKISNFQFRYDRFKPNIIGEYIDGSHNDEITSGYIDTSQYLDEDINISAFKMNQIDSGEHIGNNGDGPNGGGSGNSNPLKKNPFKHRKHTEHIKRINYGDGIKTLKLHEGKLMEIDEFKSDENSENDEENEKEKLSNEEKAQKQNQEEENNINQDDISCKEFNTTFKSRKALNEVINDKKPPLSIRNLKITANILMVSLFTIACIDYFITEAEFNDIRDNLKLINLSNQRISEAQNILSKVRDLNLIQMGLYNTTYNNPSDLQLAISNSLISIERIQQELQLIDIGLSNEHKILLNNPVIPIQFQIMSGQTQTLYYNLNDATQQIISKAFNLKNTAYNLINNTNNDYYFLTYNLFNEYYESLRNSSEYYVNELINRTSQKGNVFMILLIVSGVSLTFAMLILFPVLFHVNKTKEELLCLFLDIPEKVVKGLYSKCENFLSNLQIGEDEDMVSDIGDNESFDRNNEDDVDLQNYHPRKRRKKFKNSGNNQRKFFVNFLIGACVIETFFIYNYFQSLNLLDNINSIIHEFNATSMADSYYSFANNAERQMMINSSFPIINSFSLDVAVNNIKAMYSIDSTIHQDHSINIKIHSDNYNNIFNQIMMQNPCSLIGQNFQVNYDTCVQFADGAVYQGMAVALTRYFENLRYLLTLYVKFNNNPDAEFDATNSSVYVTLTNYTLQKNNQINILNSPQAFEVDTTQHTYIKESFELLMRAFEQGLNNNFDTNSTQRLIFYILFNIALVITYFIFWIPLANRLNRDIWRTKSMLTMIPLNVVAKIKSVRLFLRKFLNDRSVSSN